MKIGAQGHNIIFELIQEDRSERMFVCTSHDPQHAVKTSNFRKKTRLHSNQYFEVLPHIKKPDMADLTRFHRISMYYRKSARNIPP